MVLLNNFHTGNPGGSIGSLNDVGKICRLHSLRELFYIKDYREDWNGMYRISPFPITEKSSWIDKMGGWHQAVLCNIDGLTSINFNLSRLGTKLEATENDGFSVSICQKSYKPVLLLNFLCSKEYMDNDTFLEEIEAFRYSSFVSTCKLSNS